MKKFLRNYTPQSLRDILHNIQSRVANLYYGFPDKKLKIIGVTGTSGKTTTSNMIYHVLKTNGLKAGLISTNGVKIGDKTLDSGFHVTTPDPIDLQKYLKIMVDNDIEYVILETSSHAIAQKRLGNINFEVCVITNIKSDHLDWHGTWENYATAKASIGLKTKETGHLVMSRDDKKAYEFVREFLKSKDDKTSIISYSVNELQGIQEGTEGVAFKLASYTYFLPVLGSYNVENALATLNACILFGLTNEQIVNALATFRGVEGRMQIMQKTPFYIIVDFAHNTDSLEKSLQSAKKLATINGKIISVFGSAGLRDVEKRFTMGQISAELADITIVTAEDPRIEKLYDINSEIIRGTADKGAQLVKRFKDQAEYRDFLQTEKLDIRRNTVYVFDEESTNSRYDAIDFAIRIASPGDVVITEGKGHEKSLCFGTIEYPFTDHDAVRRVLQPKTA